MALEQIESEKGEEVSRKYEPESRIRRLKGSFALIFGIIAVAFSLFHLYTAGAGTFQAYKQRAVHLAFVLPLIFLLYPSRKREKVDSSPLLV